MVSRGNDCLRKNNGKQIKTLLYFYNYNVTIEWGPLNTARLMYLWIEWDRVVGIGGAAAGVAYNYVVCFRGPWSSVTWRDQRDVLLGALTGLEMTSSRSSIITLQVYNHIPTRQVALLGRLALRACRVGHVVCVCWRQPEPRRPVGRTSNA